METSNRQIKEIIQKTVKPNRKDWREKLRDALWAYHTAYKTVIGTTPYKLVYGKPCHLPVEIEYKAYWDIRECNMSSNLAGERRMLELHELEELRNEAYENSLIYKARLKDAHDKKIKVKHFERGMKVLLFNSRLRLHPGKLRSKWSGPYIVEEVYESGSIRICKMGADDSFIVNGHRLKQFYEEGVNVLEEFTLSTPA